MPRRSIRAFCPRCRHQQPFVRAHFDWKLHTLLTVVTAGIWGVVLISALLKRVHWPWRCEHCGWHEPDFRSPEERLENAPKPPVARKSGSWRREKNRAAAPGASAPAPDAATQEFPSQKIPPATE